MIAKTQRARALYFVRGGRLEKKNSTCTFPCSDMSKAYGAHFLVGGDLKNVLAPTFLAYQKLLGVMTAGMAESGRHTL